MLRQDPNQPDDEDILVSSSSSIVATSSEATIDEDECDQISSDLLSAIIPSSGDDQQTKMLTGYCVLCWNNDKPFEELIIVTNICLHLACRTCIRNYLELEIKGGNCDIQCPACPQLIDENDIRDLFNHNDEVLLAIEANRVRSRNQQRRISLLPQLVDASHRGDLGLVSHLIEQGADYNAIDEATKWTPLMYASRFGQLDVATFLIDHCGVMMNFLAPNGWTPLLVAVEHGHLQMAEMLISRGAYVNAKLDVDQTTPLIIAACNGSVKVVRLLLEKEAAINVKDCKGWSALVHAVSKGHLGVVELLLQFGSEPDEDKFGPYDFTPLMLAAYNGHLAIVQLLVRSGKADVTVLANSYSCNALHLAAVNNQSAVVDWLLTNTMAAKQDEKITASSSAYLKHFQLIAKLVEKKSEIDRILCTK